MQGLKIGVVVLLSIMVAACHQQPDLDSLRDEVLDLHRSFIQAHLDKDAAFIAKPTSPDYLFVSEGNVSRRDAAEMEHMLSQYLNATEFSHYEDVAEPLVGIAADGSVAWTIVQVRVAGTSSLDDGSTRTYDTLWAWITLYERRDDQWLRLVDVSTNRPFQEQG